jgi:hypothetical protein
MPAASATALGMQRVYFFETLTLKPHTTEGALNPRYEFSWVASTSWAITSSGQLQPSPILLRAQVGRQRAEKKVKMKNS